MKMTKLSWMLSLVATLTSGCAAGVGAPPLPDEEDAGLLEDAAVTLDSGEASEDAAVTEDAGATSDAGPGRDAGAPGDAGTDAGAPADAGQEDSGEDAEVIGPTPGVSRCTRDGIVLTCEHEKLDLHTGPQTRTIFYQTPIGNAPPEGWPVVLIFQPSIYWAEAHWTGITTVMGQTYATETIRTLLDAGYAVITPQAQALVNTVWETNVPLINSNWSTSNDHALMLALFEGIEDGLFGELDPDTLFATGMSSGGYMTSRMALSYPGKFRALAIQSASWATCIGPIDTRPRNILQTLCSGPSSVPPGHPPTLFVHGTLDLVVGIGTMRSYYDKLVGAGVPARKVEVSGGSHEFFQVTPAEMLAWFEAYR